MELVNSSSMYPIGFNEDVFNITNRENTNWNNVTRLLIDINLQLMINLFIDSMVILSKRIIIIR